MSADQQVWLRRVEQSLSAHFKQPDGSSRPGMDWQVSLKRGDEFYSLTVRTYFADDLSPALAADQVYVANTVLGYVDDLLSQGWHPDDLREHAIVVGAPPAPPSNSG